MKKSTLELIREMQAMPMGNMYLEKGIIQKELCFRWGLDFYTVTTTHFESLVEEKLKNKITKDEKDFIKLNIILAETGRRHE